jgi:peptide/nickel transport system permease protein
MASSVVLLLCLLITLLDSLHFRRALPAAVGSAPGVVAYEPITRSVLDAGLHRLIDGRETTYSLPLATHSFIKESVEVDGQVQRAFPRLDHGGQHLKDPDAQWLGDVLLRAGLGALGGGLLAVVVAWALRRGLAADERLPWQAAAWTMGVLSVAGGVLAGLATGYHVFGTDRTGNDVLYQVLKSIRTAFVIGTLSTLATLPFAVGLGLMAGYFRGWVDELIQYVYTVLSSVPNVLLIAALVLMIQVYLDKNPDAFATGAERSDLKLFFLCLVLGATGWAGLCRLVRAEVLKLRELEYVQAATAFGISPWRILGRHLLPNVMHLVIITTVLDFSALILYEAVLTYVGVGVDPSMNSFGGMINLARDEMARDPLVWWSFASAFVFMVGLVLAINLFADGVQQAFDPRARAFKPRLAWLRSAAQGASR